MGKKRIEKRSKVKPFIKVSFWDYLNCISFGRRDGSREHRGIAGRNETED